MDRSRSSSCSSKDDHLLDDCYLIQQRLLDTERSLLSLTLTKSSANQKKPGPKMSSPHSETTAAPILTLADLTPTSESQYEENFSEVLHNRKPLRGYSSLQGEEKSKVQEFMSNSYSYTDQSSLRKKLTTIREENSVMFLQNNKLMTELENASFKLQQYKTQINELQEFKENFLSLEDELKKKNYAFSELESVVVDLRLHTNKVEGEKEDLQKENQLLNNHAHSLKQHSQSLEEKRAELEEKCESVQEENESHKNKISGLLNEKKEDEKKFKMLTNEIEELQSKCEEITILNDRLQVQLTKVKAELNKPNDLQLYINALSAQKDDLRLTVETQAKKIREYEQEVVKTKHQLQQLENLVNKFQEDKSLSREDSGVAINLPPPSLPHCETFGSMTLRTKLAQLEMRLAEKDTEILRLKTAITNTTLKSSDSDENDVKESFRKRRDKENIATAQKNHEEISRQCAQIEELTASIDEKNRLIEALEEKLNARNNRLVQMQKDTRGREQQKNAHLKQIETLTAKLQTETKQRNDAVANLENSVYEKEVTINKYSEKIIQLENLVIAHEEETKSTDSLITKVKALHEQHCAELEQQIDVLQKKVHKKSKQISNMDVQISKLLKEGTEREDQANDMKEYVNKMEQLIKEKESVVEQLKSNLEQCSSKSAEQSTQHHKTVEGYQTDVARLQQELLHLQNQLESQLSDNNKVMQTNALTVNNLEAELSVKSKHIADLQESIKENLCMLEVSNKRIAELEDTHDAQVDSLQKTSGEEKQHMRKQLNEANARLAEAVRENEVYKSQCMEMNSALEEAKLKFVEVGEELKQKESKLIALPKQVEEKDKELSEHKRLHMLQVEELNSKSDLLHRQEEEAISRDENLESTLKQKNILEQQLCEKEEELLELDKLFVKTEEELKRSVKDKEAMQEAIQRSQRMLAISEDGLIIKEKGLNTCYLKIEELQKALDERQWSLREKAAQFTQLDMAFKSQKNEWDTAIERCQYSIDEMRKSIEIKDNKTVEMNGELETVRHERDELSRKLEEKESMLKLQEEGNKHSSAELKLLNKELEKCQESLQVKLRMENDVGSVMERLRNMEREFQLAEGELIDAQKTSNEQARELENLQHLLASKEQDCSRLARELGASQVREAQERARLEQELVKANRSLKHGIEQRDEQFDSIRSELDSKCSEQQQQMLAQQMQLQRADSDLKLCERDLQRARQQVGELQGQLNQLQRNTHEKRQRSRDLEESLLLKDAEIARLTARVSGFERSAFTNRQYAGSTRESKSFIPRPSQHNSFTRQERGALTMADISPCNITSLNDVTATTESSLESIGALSISSLSTP